MCYEAFHHAVLYIFSVNFFHISNVRSTINVRRTKPQLQLYTHIYVYIYVYRYLEYNSTDAP
jgi:hypothetical protein